MPEIVPIAAIAERESLEASETAPRITTDARESAEPPSDPRPKPAPTAASASLFAEADVEVVSLSLEEKISALDVLRAEVCVCRQCPHLASTRTQTVFGEGNPATRLMFVGEAPGADEDRTGRPFVGRAGMLLTDMITKGMGLTREEVYIANVLKSRPPENRTPTQEEIETCRPFLMRQIEIIRPQFLCLLGRVAVTALLETALPLSRLRQKWHHFKGIPTIVTYHPSYLLRNPPSKKEAWEDLQMLMGAMGLKVPTRK
jgi:DNA polymerase